MKPLDPSELKMEQEANLFARCLLMPEDLIRRELAERPYSIDLIDGGPDLKRLAKRFEVSELMMAMRLVEIGVLSVI